MASKFHSNRLEQYSAGVLNRRNRRKTTKARRTQVIQVPKYVIRKDISENDKLFAALILNEDMKASRSDLFVLNPSPWSGKKKFIYHDRPTV